MTHKKISKSEKLKDVEKKVHEPPKKRKNINTHIYHGFGFPVVLSNIPAKKIRGEWVPFINFVALANHVLSVLCFIQESLTGDQVFFIRNQIRLTGLQLAELLGVTQAAVSKWEKKKNKVAKIEPAIELCLRFIALEYLEEGSEQLRKLFLKKHLLGLIKKKLKDSEFIPSPLKLDGCFYEIGIDEEIPKKKTGSRENV